jgi:uncharacterized protein
MSAQEPAPAPAALSEQEMEALDNFLMSDATSGEVMMLDQLDGFLTALACSPSLPAQQDWMAQIWGPTAEDAPNFESEAQQAHITDLLTRHLSAIVYSLEQELESFEPIFDMNEYEGDEHEYLDGENWAHGFMTGISMQRAQWKTFFDARHSAEVLRPIHLLGSADISAEEEALVETPAQREAISRLIPASIGVLYKFWAPQRRKAEQAHAPNANAKAPKISRNAPCICGSGRKYKKCCGKDQSAD